MRTFYETLQKVDNLNIKPNTSNQIIDQEFNEAMDDDFNTAKAVANLFGYFKTINYKLANNDNTAITDAIAIKETYSLLGLFKQTPKEFLQKTKKDSQIPTSIKELAEKRWQAKLNKDWTTADTLRKELLDLGYSIKDSKDTYEIIKEN